MWKIQEFGHFEVLLRADGTPDELGRGAMGVTYKAFDRNLLSIAVVKVIHPQHADAESSKRQFLIEAQGMARLSHSSIPHVYYLGTSESGPFYAMEYCDGPCLQQYIESHGRLSPVEVFALAKQVASALNVVHQAGLVHRDIKPSNLILTEESDGTTRIKLIDFGLARNYTFDSVGESERFAGTPMFASPEQFDPQSGVDIRTDIYSLGIVLWYMLTGAPPFKGKLLDLMQAQSHAPVPWEKLGDVPEVFRKILAKMLAKKREERYADPKQLEEAVRVALGTEASKPVMLKTGQNWSAQQGGALLGDCPYELLKPIADESFGRRFLARDIQTDREVTLVLLHPRYGAHEMVLEAIRNARVRMRRALHPSLMRVLGQNRIHERVAYALDYTGRETKSLSEWCLAKKGLTLFEAVGILTQLADVYDLGQELGLSWMPDKPERILIEAIKGTLLTGTVRLRMEPVDPGVALAKGKRPAGGYIGIFRDLALYVFSLVRGSEGERCCRETTNLDPASLRSGPNQKERSSREYLTAVCKDELVVIPPPPEWLLNVENVDVESISGLDTLIAPPEIKTSKENVDESTTMLPGLGTRPSSLWSEILKPASKPAAQSQPIVRTTDPTSEDWTTDPKPSEKGARKSQLQAAVAQLENDEDLLRRKRLDIEQRLGNFEEQWQQRDERQAEERAVLEKLASELEEMRQRKVDLDAQLVKLAQDRFLEIETRQPAHIAEWNRLQNSLENQLEDLLPQIEMAEAEMRQRGRAAFQHQHRELRNREEYQLSEAAALEKIIQESQSIETQKRDLEALLAKFQQTRKRRMLAMAAVLALSIGGAAAVAHQVKGRLLDWREVAGEDQWRLLEQERGRAKASQNWLQLLHWSANTHREAQKDDAVKGFVQRHFQSLQEDVSISLEKLSQILDEGVPLTLDKNRVLADLNEVKELGLQNEALLLKSRIEIGDLVAAKSWDQALNLYNMLRRVSGQEAALQVQPVIKKMMSDIWLDLPHASLKNNPQSLLIEMRQLIAADRIALDESLIELIEIALSAEIAEENHQRISALEFYIDLARKLEANHRKDHLNVWWPRLETLLAQPSLPRSQLLQEQTLWAEISRLWNRPQPLEVLARTVVKNPSNKTEEPLLPAETRLEYLARAAKMGSDYAREKLEEKPEQNMQGKDLLAEANHWFLGHPEHENRKDYLRAKSLAKQLSEEDVRRAMLLALIAGAEAEESKTPMAQKPFIQEARTQFLKAANLGDVRGYLFAAKCDEALGDNTAFLETLQKGADAGSAECAYTLGMKIVATDETKAMTLMIRAAELGHAAAMEWCKKGEKHFRDRGLGGALDRLFKIASEK